MPARRRLEVRALWFHSVLPKERVKNRVALEGQGSRVGRGGGPCGVSEEVRSRLCGGD